MPTDRVEDWCVDREVEACCQCDSPQHPDGIFDEPLLGIAYRPDNSGAEVVQADDVVDDREGGDVVAERVDREIAAERILLRGAEGVFPMKMGEIGCGLWRMLIRLMVMNRRRYALLHHFFTGLRLPAERRNFDDLVPELHVRQP